jgi:hypothetical protein
MIGKAIKHFHTINKHRFLVFRLCLKCGIGWQGLLHDLSKYSPTEFFEAVKYYTGDKSPNANCIKQNGYSLAWLHHKGRNKHHHEYWYDYYAIDKTPIIPYKYVAEMICDNLAAGIIYNGKNWTPNIQYEYWLKRKDKYMINKHVVDMILEVLRQVGEEGIDTVITKENLKKQYAKYCRAE